MLDTNLSAWSTWAKEGQFSRIAQRLGHVRQTVDRDLGPAVRDLSKICNVVTAEQNKSHAQKKRIEGLKRQVMQLQQEVEALKEKIRFLEEPEDDTLLAAEEGEGNEQVAVADVIMDADA